MDVDFLIRVRDKINPNNADDNDRLFKRGDVICYKIAGEAWSPIELANSDWRILRVTGISKAQADWARSHQLPENEAHIVKRRRSVKIDLDDVTLPNVVKNWLLDDGRSTPIFTVTVAQIIDFVKAKSPEYV